MTFYLIYLNSRTGPILFQKSNSPKINFSHFHSLDTYIPNNLLTELVPNESIDPFRSFDSKESKDLLERMNRSIVHSFKISKDLKPGLHIIIQYSRGFWTRCQTIEKLKFSWCLYQYFGFTTNQCRMWILLIHTVSKVFLILCIRISRIRMKDHLSWHFIPF